MNANAGQAARLRLIAVAAVVPLAFAGVAVASAATSGGGEVQSAPAGGVAKESLLPKPTVTSTASATSTPVPSSTPTQSPTQTPIPTQSAAASGSAEPTGTSPGSSGSAPATSAAPQRPASDGTVSVVYAIDTDDPVYFITVDDGMHQDPVALRMVQEQGIPITAFLTEWTTAGNPQAAEYFRQITAYGGSIQNHTMLHASLDDPATDLEFEICRTQEVYAERFGTAPWMLRPPYGAGAGNQAVLDTAASCGIDTVVMWNVTVAKGGKDVQYWDPPLRSGDIVLAHFETDFSADLARILALGKAQGLRPASLEDYLR